MAAAIDPLALSIRTLVFALLERDLTLPRPGVQGPVRPTPKH